MIIIADSGSSKIDWRILESGGSIRQASSPGFNPYYQPLGHLKESIKEFLVPQIKGDVEKVFFYGTGVSSERNQEMVRSAFLEFFRR